jgi:putative SOS response-associated peptidase YedK
MCGRYSITTAPEAMRRLFRFTNPVPELPPRYNAAPTDKLPVVRLDREGNRELAVLRWGLIPFWAKDEKIGFKSINARAETASTAPAFREAFRHRHCLVPATGFYEWKKLPGGGKQPYNIRMRDGSPMAFAGLWERWRKGQEPIETFTIITGQPNSLTAELHDRMPVILEPDHWDTWLAARDMVAMQAMLQPFPAQLMRAYPVSQKVGNVKNDTPDLIEPLRQNAEPKSDLFS